MLGSGASASHTLQTTLPHLRHSATMSLAHLHFLLPSRYPIPTSLSAATSTPHLNDPSTNLLRNGNKFALNCRHVSANACKSFKSKSRAICDITLRSVAPLGQPFSGTNIGPNFYTSIPSRQYLRGINSRITSQCRREISPIWSLLHQFFSGLLPSNLFRHLQRPSRRLLFARRKAMLRKQ